MAKKSNEKLEDKKVTQDVETIVFAKEVKKEENKIEPIIEDEILEPLNVLEENITLDAAKISKEIDEMKEEIFDIEKDSKVKKENVKAAKKEIKEEKVNKPIYKRLMGYIWNGQEFDI